MDMLQCIANHNIPRIHLKPMQSEVKASVSRIATSNRFYPFRTYRSRYNLKTISNQIKASTFTVL